MAEQYRKAGLRVVLDARVPDGLYGGVQQWVLGLASAFSALEPNGDEYLFLVDEGREHWLTPYVSGPARILRTRAKRQRAALGRSGLRARLAEIPGARPAWRAATAVVGRTPAISSSDGTVEEVRADVVHFTFQDGFLTDLPTLYQPWDLQHLHMPGFFTRQELARREHTYRTFCERATVVITATNWVKQDVAAQYGIPRSRIAVVNVPPVTSAYSELTLDEIEAVRRRLALPSEFAFYPAQTWPHKNHPRLVRALATLRSEGIRVPLVCSGLRNEHHRRVLRLVRNAGLEDAVHFVGFVAPNDVQALYRSARLLVFPSLYEGWGLPIVEAFRAGLPVACSNVTSLPELVGDAALVFEPSNEDDIADAIRRLWTDGPLAADLRERGLRRVQRFSWRETALTLRAHYRNVAGWPMDPDDQRLLAAPQHV